ncbi:MAG: RnfABCDGE type electron transport complex subunit D [Minisyncoccia bacterium]
MPAFIDDFLNRTTMYRLVLYFLIVLAAAAVTLCFVGILPYSLVDFTFSTLLILAVCWLVNVVFAKGFGAATNVESVYITGLILALIISPVAPSNYAGVGFLVFASAWAMASKYILAIGKKHVFNPAAFGVALSAFVIGQSATWWVGNLALLPVVFIGGVLIVRKIRRFDLVASFMLVSIVTILAAGSASDYLTLLNQTLLHSAFFFLAFVMLTEPLTMPSARWSRVIYGALVGFLFAPNIHLGSFYLTPELALLAGNLFAYAVSPKGRFMLELVGRKKLGTDIYEFLFTPDRPFAFAPGQYLEWALPHASSDSRGNRRYFTIASAPTEKTINLAVKFYEPESSFKRALARLRLHDVVSVSHLSGDFTLPRNAKKKLAFIAGGIGITPFRSMIQYMLDTGDTRSTTLLYANKTAAEIAYRELFELAAEEMGLKTVYALSNEPNSAPGTYSGPIDTRLIAREIPDYTERIFYISGPHSMVDAFKKTLRAMGVSRWNIKADYFPGLA